jgi:hypothetical protein
MRTSRVPELTVVNLPLCSIRSFMPSCLRATIFWRFASDRAALAAGLLACWPAGPLDRSRAANEIGVSRSSLLEPGRIEYLRRHARGAGLQVETTGG